MIVIKKEYLTGHVGNVLLTSVNGGKEKMKFCRKCNIEKPTSEVNKSTGVCYLCEYQQWCKLILGDKYGKSVN